MSTIGTVSWLLFGAGLTAFTSILLWPWIEAVAEWYSKKISE